MQEKPKYNKRKKSQSTTQNTKQVDVGYEDWACRLLWKAKVRDTCPAVLGKCCHSPVSRQPTVGAWLVFISSLSFRPRPFPTPRHPLHTLVYPSGRSCTRRLSGSCGARWAQEGDAWSSGLYLVPTAHWKTSRDRKCKWLTSCPSPSSPPPSPPARSHL